MLGGGQVGGSVGTSTVFDKVYGIRAAAWEPRPAGERVAAGLALSGGGFRAMLFHAGALRRLHEVDALRPLSRISAVSGGSIAAAMLARAWPKLVAAPGNVEVFRREVEDKLLDVAGQRIDMAAGLTGLLIPRRSVAESVAKRYEKIFPGFTLQMLPDSPRFVFCATNLGSGSLMRFAKAYSADQRIGKREGLDLAMAQVVAASAAFPPALSPMRIDLGAQALTEQFNSDNPAELAGEGYDRVLQLSDGGVYDNLGLQPLEQLHTVLVSDGGGPFLHEHDVKTDWVRHMIRAWKVTDSQVRALRRSGLVGDFGARRRNGAFWAITTRYSDYPANALEVHDSWATYLKQVPTRLHPIAQPVREQLINFGYGLADAAIRSHVAPNVELGTPNWPFSAHALDEPAPQVFDAPPMWKFWR